MHKDSKVYKIQMLHHNKVIDLFARYIYQSEIFGFVEIEDFVFEEPEDQLLINPSLEALKKEFSGVKRSFVPMQNILRIDEVVEVGESKIADLPDDKSDTRLTNQQIFNHFNRNFFPNEK